MKNNKLVNVFYFITLILLFCFFPSLAYANNNLTWNYVDFNGYTNSIFVASPLDNNLILTNALASQRKLLKTVNGGEKWIDITSNLPSNPDINSIAMSHSDKNIIYVGIYNKGIYKTINGGSSWLSLGLSDKFIRSIAVSPVNHNVILAGTGTIFSDDGVYKSIDGGDNWQLSNTGIGQNFITELAFHPSEFNTVYACGYGIWQSDDTGNSWTKLSINGEVGDNAFVIDPIRPKRMLAGQWGKGVYKTEDGGKTWSKSANGMGNLHVHSLELNPLNPDVVYATTRTDNSGVFVSNNFGASWQAYNQGLPSKSNTVGLIAPKPNKIILGVMGKGIWDRHIDNQSSDSTPIVLLPGHGGCWSTEAMVYDDPSAEWEITPFVGVYDNFKNSLEDSGYQENQDFYTFCYDWRKSLDLLADDLKGYLDNLSAQNPDQAEFNLVGHSMGGLVARSYMQKYSDDHRVNKIITVGTPNKGALKAYYGWQAGKSDDHLTLKSLAFELFLQAKRPFFDSRVEVVHALAPSTLDFLPTFDFLKNHQDGSVIPTSTLPTQNTWLKNLNNTTTSDELEKTVNIHALENESDDTVEFYRVQEPNWLDILLGRWPDGKPVENEFTPNGDLTVLTKSATMSGVVNTASVTANHTQMIQTQEGLEAVFDSLDLENVSINTSVLSTLSLPSLVFWMQSPAKISVNTPNGELFNQDNQGLVYITSVQDGAYSINVEALESGGDYQLTIGQITQQKQVWDNIQDHISAGENLQLELNFNSQNLQNFPIVPSDPEWLFENSKESLQELNLRLPLRYLNRAQDKISKNKHYHASFDIKRTIQYLVRYYRRVDSPEKRNKIKLMVTYLTKAYELVSSQSGKTINNRRLNSLVKAAQMIFERSTKVLEKLKPSQPDLVLGNLYLWQKETLGQSNHCLADSCREINAWLSRLIGREVLIEAR